MKKFKIQVCEKIILNHEYIIELPEDINDEDIWNKIEKSDYGKDDVYVEVENVDGSVLAFSEDGSGGVELEVVYVEEV